MNTNGPRCEGAPRAAPRVQVLLRAGCDGQYPAEQGGPLQGPRALLMEGPQRGVVARVERGGLFPQRVLACPPRRAVPDLDVRKARLAEADSEVRPAQPGRDPLVGAVKRLPAGQRHPTAGLEDPADLLVGDGRLVKELDGVGAQHGLDAGIGQARRRELAGAETRVAHAHSRGLLPRLSEGPGREVYADERRPGL